MCSFCKVNGIRFHGKVHEMKQIFIQCSGHNSENFAGISPNSKEYRIVARNSEKNTVLLNFSSRTPDLFLKSRHSTRNSRRPFEKRRGSGRPCSVLNCACHGFNISSEDQGVGFFGWKFQKSGAFTSWRKPLFDCLLLRTKRGNETSLQLRPDSFFLAQGWCLALLLLAAPAVDWRAREHP